VIVVKAYTDGDGDSVWTKSGSDEQRLFEVVGRSRLSHDGDGKGVRVIPI
jgi:hypothetical protein